MRVDVLLKPYDIHPRSVCRKVTSSLPSNHLVRGLEKFCSRLCVCTSSGYLSSEDPQDVICMVVVSRTSCPISTTLPLELSMVHDYIQVFLSTH